jgi:hypothetical protein
MPLGCQETRVTVSLGLSQQRLLLDAEEEGCQVFPPAWLKYIHKGIQLHHSFPSVHDEVLLCIQ